MATRTRSRSGKPARDMKPEFSRIATAVMIRAGRLPEAQSYADASRDTDAHTLMAAAYLAEQNYELAKGQYLEALKAGETEAARQGAAALFVYLAAGEAARGEWHEASDYLTEAVRADSENPILRRYSEAVQTAALMRGISADKIEEAIPHLEKLQAEDPGRADIAHQLAMMYHRWAIELEQTGTASQRDHAWERAFANWALAIESDEYWRRWDESREFVYGKPIDNVEVEKLRHTVIGKVIRDIHNQFIKLYSDSNKRSHLDRHKALRVTWVLELAMARALHETIKLLQSKGKTPPVATPSGPLMWKHLDMADKVAETARAALKLSSAFAPAQEVLNGLTPVGITKIMIEEGQLMEAIVLLEEHLDKSPKDAAARGLIASAYMKYAQIIVGGDLEEAIGYWVKAKSFGYPVSEVENEIGNAVFQAAKKHEDNRALDKAEATLKLGLKHAPSSKTLRDKLAQLANQRALNLINGLRQGSSPSEITSAVERAQKILQDADRLVGPNHPVIQKSLKELSQIRSQMVKAEATALNNKALEMVNALEREFARVQYMNSWERQSLCQKLREAENMLARAYELSGYESQVRQNLDQIRTLAAAVCRY